MKYRLPICAACIAELQKNWKLAVPKSLIEIYVIPNEKCSHNVSQSLSISNPSEFKNEIKTNPELLTEVASDMLSSGERFFIDSELKVL